MDIVNSATRSRMMASVRQRDTVPELNLRRALHRIGFRYRLHERKLPGRPDLVLPRYRCVIFVHGCYWHAHGCKYSTVPKTRAAFWSAKFAANRDRDMRAIHALLEQGWRAMVVWECALRTEESCRAAALRVARWLTGTNRKGEIPRPRLRAAMQDSIE